MNGGLHFLTGLAYPLFVILTSCFYRPVYGQQIGDVFTLDTIITIHHLPLKNVNPQSNTKVTSNRNAYIIHAFNRFKTDSFYFTTINKQTKNVNHVVVYAPNLKQAIFSAEAHAIAANTNQLFVAYFNLIACFNLTYKGGQISEITFAKTYPISQSYQYIAVSEEGELTCANIYNASKTNQQENALVHRYSLQNDTLTRIKELYPDFNDVVFSHFNPHHWFTSNNKYMVVSQTTTYELNIYNKAGDLLYKFDAKKPDWVQMDKKVLKRIYETVPHHFPGILIDSLARYNDRGISRVEGVWLLNEDSLLVRYFRYDSISKLKIRYWDMYRLDQHKATLLAANMADGKFPIDIHKIVTPTNHDMLSWNYTNTIANNQIIIVKNYAQLSAYFGKEWTAIKQEEELFYKKNDPLLTLLIFTLRQ